MNQAFDGGVMLFTEGIESQFRVVWQQGGPQRDELAANGILKRVAPVSHTESVRCDANSHWSNTDGLLDLAEEVISGLDLRKW